MKYDATTLHRLANAHNHMNNAVSWSVLSVEPFSADKMSVLLSSSQLFQRQPGQRQSQQCITVGAWPLQPLYAPQTSKLYTFVLAFWLYVVPVEERERQPTILFRQHHVNSQQLATSLALLPGSNTLHFEYQPIASSGLPPVTLTSCRRVHAKQWLHVTVACMEGGVSLFFNGCLDSQQKQSSKLLDQGWPTLFSSSLQLGSAFNGILHSMLLGTDLSTMQSMEAADPDYPPDDAKSPPPLRCHPLQSLNELLDFSPAHNPDPLNVSSVPLRHRPPVNQQNRVIHCHHLRGGYTDDAYAPGASPADIHASAHTAQLHVQSLASDPYAPSLLSYSFTHWHLIDIFIYCSRRCVTLPPQQWIHTAHRNGVLCLGTLLIERVEQTCVMLEDEESSHRYADQLVALAVYYGFDGWLVHIWAHLPVDGSDCYEQRLYRFVAYLRQQLHQAIPQAMLLVSDAKVQALSGLTQQNLPLFQAADGLLTNAKWQAEALVSSATVAESVGRAATDIYMAIDVSSYGMNSYLAVQQCFDAGLSVGLIAPSYTAERLCMGSRATRAMMRRYERKLWDVNDFQELDLATQTWQPDVGSEPWSYVYDASLGCKVLVAPPTWGSKMSAQQMRVDLTDIVAAQSSQPVPSISCLMQYKGTPDISDQLRIVISVYNASNEAVDVYDSGPKKCAGDWQSLEYQFNPAYIQASYLDWRIEGMSAGCSGPSMTLPLLLLSKQPRKTMSSVVHSRRLSFVDSLPLHHAMHTGLGRTHVSNAEGVCYSNYDQQATRSLASYQLLHTDKDNELVIDEPIVGDCVEYATELDCTSRVYPAPALQWGATNYRSMHGKGYWMSALRLLEFSPAAPSKPFNNIDQLYVYVTLRTTNFITKLHSYIRLQLADKHAASNSTLR